MAYRVKSPRFARFLHAAVRPKNSRDNRVGHPIPTEATRYYQWAMKTPISPPPANTATASEWMLNGPDFFKKVVADRRATRHFEEEAVPDTVLRSILELARQAPSGYNFQPARFVVARDLSTRQRLRKAAFNQEKITEAPVVITAFGQRYGWKERIDEVMRQRVENGVLPADAVEATKKGALDFIQTIPPAVWLNRHVMIAFTFLMLAAESFGWDTAPLEGYDAKAVREVLTLPDDAEVVALLAIGRARRPVSQYPGRLPLTEVVFAERFGQPWPADPT